MSPPGRDVPLGRWTSPPGTGTGTPSSGSHAVPGAQSSRSREWQGPAATRTVVAASMTDTTPRARSAHVEQALGCSIPGASERRSLTRLPHRPTKQHSLWSRPWSLSFRSAGPRPGRRRPWSCWDCIAVLVPASEVGVALVNWPASRRSASVAEARAGRRSALRPPDVIGADASPTSNRSRRSRACWRSTSGQSRRGCASHCSPTGSMRQASTVMSFCSRPPWLHRPSQRSIRRGTRWGRPFRCSTENVAGTKPKASGWAGNAAHPYRAQRPAARFDKHLDPPDRGAFVGPPPGVRVITLDP